MHFVDLNGTTLRYRVSGDPKGAPVVFANSLGTDLTIWDSVVEGLPSGYCVIGFDKRGHGHSALPTGPMSIADYASDLLALADHLKLAEYVICGVSVGGMIAQSAAALAPDRVRGLILCNTGAKIGSRQIWTERIAAVEAGGLEPMGDAVMERWFTSGFRASNPATLAGCRAMLTRTPAAGYATTCAAIRDADLTETTARLSLPTLCIAGAQDQATPPELVRTLAGLIDGARYHEIADCGHIPSVEQPGECTRVITEFLAGLSEASAFASGMVVRRKVLGDAHVDRAGALATAVDKPFQRFITEGAWGSVWSGQHFTLRERSIVTLALLAAQGQDDEVAMHARAARNTGATEQDIAETFMHVAVYAGVPRANHALKIAKAVFAEATEED